MLTRLILENFRCHKQLDLRELGLCNVLTGANGRGKTSLLEAVFLISRCRSFRTHRTKECAGWGRSSFGIAGRLAQEVDGVVRLKYEWTRAGRQLSTDVESGMKLKAFWGLLQAVAITNQDRQLVTESGRHRRSWIDSLIAATDHEYLELSQKALLLQRQKNALLKSEKTDRGLWKILTDQMRPVCSQMTEARDAMTERMAPEIEAHYRHLTHQQEHVGFACNGETKKRLGRDEEELWLAEQKSRNCELGPHRDDWDLTLEGKPLRHFGSEGQQKSAALAMRLAELKLDTTTNPGRTVVLIDDALIELDTGRRERFWHQVPGNVQVLYATTDASRDAEFTSFDQTWRVEPGNVRV
ncbi:MAG: DNA replication and repair protein RecF [Verrucomicrobiota bacterium]